ncbi:MAG: hypothetical protein KUG77_04805 [Nannocystaceae bacterium]|nr:hypothetical protein [Nannocystaceae bacterium]
MAKYEAATAGSRAGELAQTMGLQLIEGDPMLNLRLAVHASHQKSNNEETRVVLEGAPDGRATRLNYYHRRKSVRDFNKTIISTWISAEISVAVHAPFPEFEILQRDPGHYGSETKPRLAAAPHPCGDASLDAKLLIKTHDPRISHVLAPVLAVPASWEYVHIHGKDNKISFHATKTTVGYLGIADQIQQVLNEMARHLETVTTARSA